MRNFVSNPSTPDSATELAPRGKHAIPGKGLIQITSLLDQAENLNSPVTQGHNSFLRKHSNIQLLTRGRGQAYSAALNYFIFSQGLFFMLLKLLAVLVS